MKLNDGDILGEFNKQFQLMWGERQKYEADWSLSDDQVEAETLVDNYGNVKINLPVEKSVIEFYCGRVAGKLTYNAEPAEQADVDELQPAKYVLDYFLDDANQPYQFYQELKNWDYDAAKYGTSIFFTGLTHTVDKVYTLAKDSEDYYSNNYDEYKRDIWTFTPRNIPIRNFWIDYMAVNQNNFKKVRFCVMQEYVDKDIIKERWEYIKGFKNLDSINPMQNIWPEYGKTPIRPDLVILHYRYNKITKDYRIIANRNTVIYTGKMIYSDGELPFDIRQFYPKTNCIYGEGIPRRLRTDKAFKNVIMQAMMDKTIISSGINLGIGNKGMVDGELYTSPGEINIRPFTSPIDQVKQFALDGNISSQMAVLTVIDDNIIQSSGENIKAPYTSPASTATEAEILEENKQVRQMTVDNERNRSLDEVLTRVYKNIKQFAPALKREEIKVDNKLVKIKYPIITIPNVDIKKEKGKNKFIEEYGKYGFYELKPGALTGDIRIKLTTPTTRSTLRTIEKNAITQYIQNLLVLAQANPEILQKVDMTSLMDRINQAYGIDINKFAATTKKDEIKKKNIELLEQTQQLLFNQQPNETIQPTVPTIPKQMNQAPQTAGSPTNELQGAF